MDENKNEIVMTILLAILIITFIFWFLPTTNYSVQYKKYLMEIDTTASNQYYTQEMQYFSKTRPSVYRIMFGGEKNFITSEGQDTINYDEIQIRSLQWAFFFHLIAVILCIVSYINLYNFTMHHVPEMKLIIYNSIKVCTLLAAIIFISSILNINQSFLNLDPDFVWLDFDYEGPILVNGSGIKLSIFAYCGALICSFLLHETHELN